MGCCGEKTAKEYKISREDQDNYALQSYQRSTDAWKVNKKQIKFVVLFRTDYLTQKLCLWL